MEWLSFIVLLLISLWLVWRYYGATNLFQSELVFGLIVKIAFGAIYLLLFTFYFSDGLLTGDSAQFFLESDIIHTIFQESPSDFLRLLFGMSLVNENAIAILNETNLWAPGSSAEFINDNKLILKLNALIHFISFGNVFVHGLILSFFSFTGIYFTYRTFEQWVANKKLFWWVLIAFPNLAFWSSGLLKESLFVFGFGIWCWSIYKLAGKQYQYFILFIIAASFLFCNKPYAGVIIIGITILFLLGRFFNWSKKGLAIVSVLYCIIFAASITVPGKYNLTNRLSGKQLDFDNLARGGIAFINDSAFCVFPHHEIDQFKAANDSIIAIGSVKGEYKLFGTNNYKPFTISPSARKYPVYLIYKPSGSYYEPCLIGNSPSQLLKNTGASLMNVFVRPFPTDSGDQLKNFSFISNILLFALLLFAFYRRKSIQNFERFLNAGLIAASITIALIIGWSIPVFGAIVRYKIPVELLLIIVSFIILKPLKHVKA